MDNTKKFKVFYLWQNQLPSDTNRRGIYNALKQAALTIDQLNDLIVDLDEATRGLSDSPYIRVRYWTNSTFGHVRL